MIVGFDPDVYDVDESGKHVTFNVTHLSGMLNRDVVVEFFTEDGTGQGK